MGGILSQREGGAMGRTAWTLLEYVSRVFDD